MLSSAATDPEAPGEPLRVGLVRAFADNYVWLLHGRAAAQDRVAVVDPGDAAPVLAALRARALTPAAILVTHHHADHVGGIADLLAACGSALPVYGPAAESIPGRSVAVRDGDRLALGALGLVFEVLAVPGHTAGHVAYAGHGAVFCGDTLFSGGCGRLFEGTPAQMLASLDRLASLPADTRVYCAHEYTASNLRFAAAVEPGNAALAEYAAHVAARRACDEATVPSTIAREHAVNPFLRTRVAAVRAAVEQRLGRAPADDADAFAVVRRWKDEYR